MSLRGFHILFITLSVVLAIGSGIWTLRWHLAQSNTMHLTFAALSFIAAMALVVYGVWFVKESRKLIL